MEYDGLQGFPTLYSCALDFGSNSEHAQEYLEVYQAYTM
jgi:hypothetical protein